MSKTKKIILTVSGIIILGAGTCLVGDLAFSNGKTLIDAPEDTTITQTTITPANTTDTGTIPASITVDFEYKGEQNSISIDYAGYNNCREGMWGTSTEAFCKAFLRDQIAKNIQWAKEAMDAQEPQDYSSEVTDKDL